MNDIKDYPQFKSLVSWFKRQAKVWPDFNPDLDVYVIETQTDHTSLKVNVYTDEYQADYFYIDYYPTLNKWLGKYYVKTKDSTTMKSTTSYSETELLKDVKKMCKELYELPF